MALQGIIESVKAEGDQLRVVIRLPPGTAGGDTRTYLVDAGLASPEDVIADLARQALGRDVAAKASLARLTKGTVISLDPPGPITPPTPSADDVAVAAFVVALSDYQTARALVDLGLAGNATSEASAVKSLYQAGTPAQRVRFRACIGR